MRAILTNLRSGEVGTFDIPAPEIQAGGVLVRTAFSAISAGTERNTIDTGKKSLLGKALARPDLVRQVIDFAKVNGLRAAYEKVQSRLDTHACLGYSSSGIVLAVGKGVTEFQPGDRVACAGTGYASHSEISFIPRNLAAKIPDSVSLEAASLTTIGAIAMQGLRQASVSFGETVAVIGAGLLGVITVQLARAAGCRVIAVDTSPARAKQAIEFGASLGLATSDTSLATKVQEFTKYGPDVALITASSTSVEPVELGAKLLRDRGRLVVLGSVPLGVSRELMYQKELSLVLSRSYGPGRYDAGYEELGNDYPIGYVRWTEKRNMEAFLELLAGGSINVAPLLKLRHPAEEGARAYSEIQVSGAYTAIIQYDSPQPSGPAAESRPAISRALTDTIRVGCIGAGSFARSVIFPHLKGLKGVLLESVATTSGSSAYSAQQAFGFRSAQQPAELVASPNIDALFVLSHHDTHAGYVVAALAKQKPVFVEKPLAVSREELKAITDAYESELAQGHSPFVMVGFNRRFAPASGLIREFFASRREPMVVNVRVNAGYLPRDHWAQRDQNGGRIVGELCHFVDWSRWLVGAQIKSVYAEATPDGSRYKQDNLATVISFLDGSIATLSYVANGDRSVAKEFYEVFCEGSVARLDDYTSLELIRNGKHKSFRCHRDKGHRKEIQDTITALQSGHSSPIPFEELVEVTDSTFAIIESLKSGLPTKPHLHKQMRLDEEAPLAMEIR